METLMHYGVPRRSGRYPWGSGERPYQGLTSMQRTGIKKKASLAKNVLGKNIPNERLDSSRNYKKETHLRKGDDVQHIAVGFGGKRSGQIYVTANEYDNKLYEAFLSANIKIEDGFKSSFIRESETTV